jgi:hypothetical protein
MEADTAAWLGTIQQIQNWPDPIKHIVPGRGKPCSPEELAAVAHYIEGMRQQLQDHIEAQRPREEIHSYLLDFLNRYPEPSLPTEWLKKQIKYSLDHVYDEIQLTNNNEQTR